MHVQLISHSMQPELICGTAAATCTNYDDTQKALRGSLSCGHESVIEHASFTFLISGVSRVLLAQQTRHRIASYSVQSQRYVNQADNGYVMPPKLNADQRAKADMIVNACKVLYNELISDGVDQEDARYFLPEAMQTQIVLTMNARELRHFFAMRTCNRAQWEIRELAEKMFVLAYAAAPSLFKNAFCGCVCGRCPEGKKSCGNTRETDYKALVEEAERMIENDI